MPEAADRLESWKEIAVFLGRSVSTVQRWERDECLPVHRHAHARIGSVYAFRSEIVSWRQSRKINLPREGAPVAGKPRKKVWRYVLLSLFGFGAASLAWRGTVIPEREIPIRSFPATSDAALESSPALSPDGEHIAFARHSDAGVQHIYVKPAREGSATRITSMRAVDDYPQWSADGAEILFSRLSDGHVSVHVASLRSGTERQVVRLDTAIGRHSIPVRWARWGPTRNTIILTERASLDEPYSLFEMNVGSGAKRRLTFPPTSSRGDTQFALSRDGSQIAFVRYATHEESDIYEIPVQGGEPRRLTFDSIYHDGLDWTPDGNALVYGALRQSRFRTLWMLKVNATVTSPTRISGLEGEASWPTVEKTSGSALRIAYTFSSKTVNVLRWRAPFESAPEAVCPSSMSDRTPQFSADGLKIAFISDRTGWREVWICDIASNTASQVTELKGSGTDSARWSPDSRSLVFSTSRGGNRDVFIVDTDTRKVRPVTTEPSEEGRPSWSRDGQWVYFRSNRSGREDIWRARVVDGSDALEQMTRNGGYEGYESVDGMHLYFARDWKRPGIWRMPLVRGREELVVANAREGLWAVTKGGLLVLTGNEFRLFDSTGNHQRVLKPLPRPQLPIWGGLHATIDTSQVAWTQTTQQRMDIMVREGPL